MEAFFSGKNRCVWAIGSSSMNSNAMTCMVTVLLPCCWPASVHVKVANGKTDNGPIQNSLNGKAGSASNSLQSWHHVVLFI